MKKAPKSGIAAGVVFLCVALQACASEFEKDTVMSEKIKLPPPDYQLNCDLNKALQDRRSVREYRDGEITGKEIGQLLWAAQGVTSVGGYRTAPSAGALYPLETLLVVGKAEGLTPGVYRYDPREHTLAKIKNGDVRRPLSEASLGQTWMSSSAVMVVFTAIYPRTTDRYGERGRRYVHMEAGHAGQNVLLSAVALNLGAVVVAAFDDAGVAGVLGLPEEEAPLYIMPVGRK